MKVAHNFLTAAITLVILINCSISRAESQGSLEGEQLRLALIGVWGSSDDDGRTFWGYDEFTSDGFDIAHSVIPETGKHIRSLGSYTVIGSKNCLRVLWEDTITDVGVGNEFCDDILYIDEKILRYRSPFDSKIKTLYRIKRKQ